MLKKLSSLFVFLSLSSICLIAQDAAVQGALRAKYGMAQYHTECDGWYLLSYSMGGQTMYGFADKNGNVVAENATKYKLHKGYIELYVLDAQKKADHDQWLAEKRQYDVDYQNYKRIKAQHEANMSAYNSKLQTAKNEAERRWRNAQERAAQEAKAQQERQQRQQQNNSNIALAILSGVNSGLAIANARNSVKFEPFFDQVKAERDLTVPPSEPYNPMPSLRNEPGSGFEWRNYCLLQPCPYDYIDFEKISEVGSFADVRKDGRYGLVDSYMREVVPCANTNKVSQSWLDEDRLLIHKNSGYGVLGKNGKEIIPCVYSSISKEGSSKYKVVKNGKHGLLSIDGKEIMPCTFDAMESSNGYLLCKSNGLWGVYTSNFEELYPCQYQQLSFMTVNDKLVLKTQNKGLWGVLNFNNGQPLLENRFSDISVIDLSGTEKCFKVAANNKVGLYATTGTIIIPCEFDQLSTTQLKALNSNLQVVEARQNNTIGYYSIDGVPFLNAGKYTKADFDGNCLCYVVESANGKKGVCNFFGKELVPCSYDNLSYTKELLGFMAERGESKGVVGMGGEEIFPFVECRNMSYNSSLGVMQIDRGDSYKGNGAVDMNGREILPTKVKTSKWYEKVSALKKKDATIDAAKETKSQMLSASMVKAQKEMQGVNLERDKFSFFAQNYVERVINEWQRRGEFEKKEAWAKRVNEETRKQKVFELTKEAQQTYISAHTKNLKPDEITIVGQYDPDNETYRLHSAYANKDILVKVSAEDAQAFKAQFSSLRKYPTFFIENDRIGVAEYTFEMSNGKRYKYSNQASLNYSIAQVEYNFDAITIDQSASNNGFVGGKQTISTTGLTLGTSDVDVAIPNASTQQKNTFAIIIGNENYSNEKKVDFAYNDGQVFRDYCIKAMGIPAQNVHFRANATLNDMRFEFNWIKQTAEAYKGDAKFIVYYAGHGMPDDASKEAYLLPVDGFSSDLSSGYRLSDLYGLLGEIPSQSIILLLDACFSGSQRSGETLASARGVAIRPNISEPKGNLVVFSASTDKETAHPYREKFHGLFTYYLLKKIKETDGTLEMGSLTNYVSSEVAKQSIVTNKKSQTPTVSPSEGLKSTWESLVIK